MIAHQLLIAGFVVFSFLRLDGCSPKNSPDKIQNAPQSQATPVKKIEKKGDEEKMDLLLQKVLNREPSAVNLAKEMGETAVSRLKPLATHEDSGVRMIALSCINIAAGSNKNKEITDIFVNALTDSSGTTSAEGINGLQDRLNPALYSQLLEVYDKTEDPQRRADIALLLGKIETAKIDDLRQKREKESEAIAKESLTTAMAKLGDAESRNEFTSLLQGKKDRDLKRFLEYVKYVNQTWATRSLSSVLSDRSPLVRIGTDDPMPGEIEYLRACDLALNLLVKLTGAKLSFNVDGKTNYTDAQLQEARQYLGTLR